jgi:hypothetical protein
MPAKQTQASMQVASRLSLNVFCPNSAELESDSWRLAGVPPLGGLQIQALRCDRHLSSKGVPCKTSHAKTMG